LSGEGNPSFGTILKVIKALGLKLHVQAAGKESTRKLTAMIY